VNETTDQGGILENSQQEFQDEMILKLNPFLGPGRTDIPGILTTQQSSLKKNDHQAVIGGSKIDAYVCIIPRERRAQLC
jgi:hypothetical protein